MAAHAERLSAGSRTAAASARVLEELIVTDAALLVPHIEALLTALSSPVKVVQEKAAMMLPILAAEAPAKLAKRLLPVEEYWAAATPRVRDGIMRAFAALCQASVAYQRRLEGSLSAAFAAATAKELLAWVELILPAMKGEPYANLRQVAVRRLATLPKASAQKLADQLGESLRHHRRG